MRLGRIVIAAVAAGGAMTATATADPVAEAESESDPVPASVPEPYTDPDPESDPVPEPGPVATRPIGALIATGALTFNDGGSHRRFGAAAMVYVTPRLAAHVALARTTLDFERGQVTAGIAYRAAAARPRLELMVHADAGVAWPLTPVAGAGVVAFLWPTRLPIAVATGMRADLIVDGLVDSRVAVSLALGLAIAR